MGKYIDNTTFVKIIPCGEVSHAQSADERSYWRGH